MENVDRQSFIASIGTLLELHGREQSEAMLNLYWESLRDLTPFQFKRAIARAARELKFLPKPSELRELAGVVTGEKARLASCALAWEAFRRALDKYDVYESVDFGPLVNAVLHNLGGWKELCEKSIEELVWVRKDFERVYDLLSLQPTESLRSDWHRGTFGAPPIYISIDGAPLPKSQLTEIPSPISDLIRDLANKKSDPSS